MRVFVTGATGFIGSALVPELLGAGHQVLGLARSDAAAKALVAAGAEAHRGDLEDLASLRSGAAKADGVIHAGFIHDFSRFQEVCETDRRVIEALGETLAGSNRPLLITSGTGMGSPGSGELATENHFNPHHPNPRALSEIAGNAVLEKGVNVSVIRLPQVHDPIKQGLVTYLIALAREKGVSAYTGEGLTRWPAAHVLDVAKLYRLALEKAEKGARYHAVAEEGVSFKAIAESIAKGLNIPAVSKTLEETPAHFGWLAMFANLDMPASGALTQKKLGWQPTGPGLISDLDQARF